MTTFLFISAIVIGIVGVIILQGLRKILENPPHKGQGTLLGKRIPGKFYNEGWGFFLFYPHLVGFIPVKVERTTIEIVSENTRTPDRSRSRVPIFLTFRTIPELLINYLDSGQQEGVERQLKGKVLERVREWAMGPEEGPADWIELNKSHLEAVSVLVKQIAGDSLTSIPEYAQSVPTWIWLRYFAQPKPTKFSKNEEAWTENNWQKVQEVLEKIEHSHGPEAIEELKTIIAQRRTDIENLRTGSGKIILRDLGVMLERLNLGDIDVLGGVGEEAEGEAKEEQERQKEEKELLFMRKRMEELMAPPFNFNAPEARDIVQVERGKVPRTIDDKRITLDPNTAQALGTFLGGKKS